MINAVLHSVHITHTDTDWHARTAYRYRHKYAHKRAHLPDDSLAMVGRARAE